MAEKADQVKILILYRSGGKASHSGCNNVECYLGTREKGRAAELWGLVMVGGALRFAVFLMLTASLVRTASAQISPFDIFGGLMGAAQTQAVPIRGP